MRPKTWYNDFSKKRLQSIMSSVHIFIRFNLKTFSGIFPAWSASPYRLETEPVQIYKPALHSKQVHIRVQTPGLTG